MARKIMRRLAYRITAQSLSYWKLIRSQTYTHDSDEYHTTYDRLSLNHCLSINVSVHFQVPTTEPDNPNNSPHDGTRDNPKPKQQTTVVLLLLTHCFYLAVNREVLDSRQLIDITRTSLSIDLSVTSNNKTTKANEQSIQR